jgi:hypothetical protein
MLSIIKFQLLTHSIVIKNRLNTLLTEYLCENSSEHQSVEKPKTEDT